VLPVTGSEPSLPWILICQHLNSLFDLYNKGLIYRGYRMVNWDPEAKTTLSDEEVIFEEQQGKTVLHSI
jgi:valyl-tRNA synthetase